MLVKGFSILKCCSNDNDKFILVLELWSSIISSYYPEKYIIGLENSFGESSKKETINPWKSYFCLHYFVFILYLMMHLMQIFHDSKFKTIFIEKNKLLSYIYNFNLYQSHHTFLFSYS